MVENLDYRANRSSSESDLGENRGFQEHRGVIRWVVYVDTGGIITIIRVLGAEVIPIIWVLDMRQPTKFSWNESGLRSGTELSSRERGAGVQHTHRISK